MKTYGVNWFLVWVGLLALFCPVSVWTEQVLLLSLWHTTHLHTPVLAQAFGLACCWTFLYYSIYGKILADPKAVERARQSFQRGEAARHRRHRCHRWPIMWATLFAVVGTTLTICRLIFERPSWSHVAGYSLFLPCSCLAAMWLMDIAAEKGQMAQLLRASPEEAPEPPILGEPEQQGTGARAGNTWPAGVKAERNG